MTEEQMQEVISKLLNISPQGTVHPVYLEHLDQTEFLKYETGIALKEFLSEINNRWK